MDPTDIGQINRWLADQGAAGRIGVREVVFADDLFAQLPDRLRAWGAPDRPLVVVMDATPMRRQGRDAKAALLEAIGGLRRPEVITLGAADDPPHADLEVAQQLAGRLPSGCVAISFGSGTITDLTKHARFLADEGVSQAEGRAFIAIPTACTVTAFSSALAVLGVAGVKRTLPSRGPDATWIDLPLLADAPMELTRAGVGDLLARGVAYADWYLSDRLGIDESYTDVPRRLLAAHEQRLPDIAAALARREPAACRTLMEALLLAGYAMSVVGQTTPISGWEHVMSHYLDLTNTIAGRPLNLHGLQVAAATLTATRAYDEFLREATPRDLASASEADLAARAARQIDRHFAPLDAEGTIRAELLRDYMPKADRWRAAGESLRKLSTEWAAGAMQQELRLRLVPLERLERIANLLDLPQSLTALEHLPGLAAPVEAVSHAHLVRRRFTLGDLLAAMEWLTDKRIARWLGV